MTYGDSWRAFPLFVGFACAACLGGCATHSGTGALVGSGFGAATGAIIGSTVGHAGGGAVIGAATGALAGGLIGDAEDAREERDAALYHAAMTEQSARQLHNVDLIRMTQSGLTDDVIIGSIRAQGGSFDLSPDGLIALKAAGVSDGVIVAIQQGSVGPGPGPLVPVSVIDPAPPIIVVPPPPPRPQFEVFIGGPRHCPPRRGFHFHHEWHHHH